MKRIFLIGFVVGMALLLGFAVVAFMSSCATPTRRVHHFYVGYYEKAYIHVNSDEGKIVTLETEGPGFYNMDEHILAEPLEEEQE